MKIMHHLSRLALGAILLSGAAQAANRPTGYVTICNEGKTCSVSATTNVAFGRADQFFYKSLNGSFVCSEATFGGRVAGGTNECSVPGSSSSSAAASSKAASSAAASSIAASSVAASSIAASSKAASSAASSVASSAAASSIAASSSSSTAPTGLNTVDGFANVNALGLATTTGGAGGRAVKVSTLDELKTNTDSNEKLIILVNGTINMGGMVPLRSDKTIIGLPGSKLTGGGFEIYKRQNIIIRNVTFEDAPDDALKVNQNTHHVWVDHCSFSDGPLADPEGANHDGLFDITRQTSYITITYNYFRNHSKVMLIGHSDSASSDVGYLKTTIHHNVFEGTRQRHPRVRFGEVHVYNNYFLNNELYGVASTMEADVVVEGNYFKNVPYPTYVGYAESAVGDLVQRNNVLDNSGAFQTRGSAFDPASYYSYTVDNPASIPALVSKAGVGVIDPWKAAGVAPF